MGHTDTINACTFYFSEKQCISGGNDRTLRYWDILSAKNILNSPCQSQINNIDLAASESMLTTSHLKDIKVWSAKDA